MAPVISGGFADTIFLLIKFVVHVRKNPIPWAVYTAPFFFLAAATVCTLSVVYKGSPRLGLNKKPDWYVASVTTGCTCVVTVLSDIFFVPFLYARVLKKDYTVRWYDVIKGPALLFRQPPDDAEFAKVPNYAVVQHDEDERSPKSSLNSLKGVEENRVEENHVNVTQTSGNEKRLSTAEITELTYKELLAHGERRPHAKLLIKRGPMGWGMRTLRDNPMGAGDIYELHNMAILAKCIPAMIVVGLLYGIHYDIHAAQTSIAGIPEGKGMEKVYAHAEKYSNEVEHTYSFIQILTACTASFAHGANDIGNSV